VVVTAIDPNSVAVDHGFQVGDVILDVSDKSVASCGRSHAIVDASKEGKHTLLFRLKSNAGARFIALPLGSA
jgi:S1-C subfamily serine protease